MTSPSPSKINKIPKPPYKLAAIGVLLVAAIAAFLVYGQFRGSFTPKDKMTLFAPRAGLVMDPGAKVTYNGVQIGRVADIAEIDRDGKPAAKLTLDIYPQYIGPHGVVPDNVNAQIKATTVFGGKYIAMTTPRDASGQDISKGHLSATSTLDATAVTTEINTLFQTLTSIAERVDPVKLNLTLSAAAQSLAGLGDRFGRSIVNANAVLDDLNPQQPQIRRDIQRLAALGDTYANAAPDLLDFLNNSVTTARTLNAQQKDLDQALLAAVGFGNNGADIFERGGPYLARGAADLVPTAQVLDTYSPELFCTIRNYHDIEPKAASFLAGSNGYSLRTESELLSGLSLTLNPLSLASTLLLGVGSQGLLAPIGPIAGLVGGAPNPYIYPDNLPRINARGGPGGAPGCWQPITHDLWPAPELVMDTGNSIAPYNHIDSGSPFAIEYVWGRQLGENTINP
jgi:phospholipid/cholesterol/gamma-HCH transport system substrate-binding protein